MRGQETMNEIELVRTRYKVATVDRGYHVYVVVWEATVGQILPCEQEGGNTHDPPLALLSRIMTHPLITTPSYTMKIFAVKTFANCSKTAKFEKVFTHERFPLYGT